MPYYYISYGFYMWFFLSVSIHPLSFWKTAGEWLLLRRVGSWRVRPDSTVVPPTLTDFKPPRWIMPCRPGDCISVIEGLPFNFPFLTSVPSLLKFLIQLLRYFPVFLFATFYSPVCISASISLFASVVISEWDLVHRTLQIQKERHAHSLTLLEVVRHLMEFGGTTSGFYRDFGTLNYSLSVFSLERPGKGY